MNLATCSHNKTNPVQQQFFVLRHFRDIMLYGKSDCFEGSAHGLTYARCHYEQGNQYFRFDVDSMNIIWGRKQNNLCIDADPDTNNIFINFCDKSRETQKWVWGSSRQAWLKDWTNHGAAILDKHELQPMSDFTTKAAVVTSPESCRI